MSTYSAVESFASVLGVDTYPVIPQASVRAAFMSRSVNRATHRLLNDTRPPFVEIDITFSSLEEEYTFRNAAISGMKYYEGEASLFSAFLIVAVGDRILAGYVKPNSIQFSTIYKGIDPQWMHSYFCQALNILTWNNDKDPGLYWTGNIGQMAKPITESKYVTSKKGTYPMKVSNYAVFAHGRIFYNTEFNLIYASDFIQSQGLGLEQREAVLSNLESTYPSSGDGFGSPSEMGQVTGMTVIPQSETLNGHGDVMVTCRNGMFSIAPNRKQRNLWTEDPEMQKNVLKGKGCSSNNSIIEFANQILYRDSNGTISSMLLDISAYQRGRELSSISNTVKAYTDFDVGNPNIQFCSAFTTNNRALFTICHQREASKHMGIHRYAEGMVSACLQQRGDNAAIAWEGLWTGPRVVAAVMSNIGNNKRTIIASYDRDQQNRLYFIDEQNRGDDFVRGAYQKIESKFGYRGVFFDEQANSAMLKKKLAKIEGLMINSNVQSLSATYSADSINETSHITFQLTEVIGFGEGPVRFISDDVIPASSKTRTTNSNEGFMFSVDFYVVGTAQFNKLVIAGDLPSDTGFNPVSKCDNVKADGISELVFDSNVDQRVNIFNYQF